MEDLITDENFDKYIGLISHLINTTQSIASDREIVRGHDDKMRRY